MNTIKRLSITGIISILFVLVYFVFSSKDIFDVEKMEIIPSLYYPIGVVLCVICGVILSKILNERNSILVFINILLPIFFLVSFTTIINKEYRTILVDYYKRDYSSLIQLGEYSKQKGNYIKIYSLLRDKGIDAKEIGQGYGEKYNERLTDYSTPLTYDINGDYLIILDWNTEKIIKLEPMIQIKENCYDYLSHYLNIKKEDIKTIYLRASYGRFEINGISYGVYVYARDGQFQYMIDK